MRIAVLGAGSLGTIIIVEKFLRTKMIRLSDPLRAVADSQGGINQGNVRISLWEITEQSFCRKIHIFTEKADVITVF